MRQSGQVQVPLIVAWIVFAAGAVVSIVLSRSVDVGLGLVANTLILVSGSIIVWKTDQRPIGWILVTLALIFTLSGGMVLGFQRTYDLEWTRLVTEGGIGGLWLFIYLILIFPTGRLPTLLSRVVLWIAAVGGVVVSVLGIRSALTPGDTEESAGVVFLAVVMLVVVVIQLAHLRHRSPTEKRQLKWFIYALAMSMSLYFLAVAFDVSESAFLVIDAIATSLWPIAILPAITRYRLYEIDRIVSRTVSYALVAGFLGLVFFGLVTAIGALARVRAPSPLRTPPSPWRRCSTQCESGSRFGWTNVSIGRITRHNWSWAGSHPNSRMILRPAIS